MATARVSRNETVRPLRETGERPRHLQVVRQSDRPVFRLTPKTGVGLTVVLFGALFGVAVSHALLIEGQIELDRLDEQVAEEQARYERLRLDVAELESPERILTDAQELGMVPPDEVTWLTPDQAAEAAGSGQGGGQGQDDAEAEAPGTSWVDVKPYLGTNP